MAPKSIVVAALLIAVVVSAGQLPRGAARLGAASPKARNTSLVVSGIVPCATGKSINIASVPSFPNAVTQLVCGSNVVGSTTTDSTGAFLLRQSSVSRDLIAAVLRNQCKMVVVTPLGACDQSLAEATGTLSAPLKLQDISTDSGSVLDGVVGAAGDVVGAVGDVGAVGAVGAVVGGVIGPVDQFVSGLTGGTVNLGTMSFSFV